MATKRKTKAKARAQTQTGAAGQRYRVLDRGFAYPTNAAAIKRVQGGETVPLGERGMVEAAPGEIIENVPAAAAQSLLRKEWVEEVGSDGDD